MKRQEINIGQTYGNLTIVSEADDRPEKTTGRARRFVLCKCLLCGNFKEIQYQTVKQSRTMSCGCVQKNYMRKTRTRHNESATGNTTKEYRAWQGIKKRCLNKNEKAYPNYGGWGITICKEWSYSFDKFLQDVGRAPTKDHTIDRINNDGNYEPRNVRWATRKEQNNNRRKRRTKEELNNP